MLQRVKIIFPDAWENTKRNMQIADMKKLYKLRSDIERRKFCKVRQALGQSVSQEKSKLVRYMAVRRKWYHFSLGCTGQLSERSLEGAEDILKESLSLPRRGYQNPVGMLQAEDALRKKRRTYRLQPTKLFTSFISNILELLQSFTFFTTPLNRLVFHAIQGKTACSLWTFSRCYMGAVDRVLFVHFHFQFILNKSPRSRYSIITAKLFIKPE